jgi:hypothetical protein
MIDAERKGAIAIADVGSLIVKGYKLNIRIDYQKRMSGKPASWPHLLFISRLLFSTCHFYKYGMKEWREAHDNQSHSFDPESSYSTTDAPWLAPLTESD